jgi:hypothetical protein
VPVPVVAVGVVVPPPQAASRDIDKRPATAIRLNFVPNDFMKIFLQV